MKTLTIALATSFSLYATNPSFGAEKEKDFCAAPMSEKLDSSGPKWVAIFSDHMQSIRCAGSEKELQSIAIKIRDTGHHLSVDLIDSLYNQIAFRREEIDIRNDPILVDNLERLDEIIRTRFARKQTRDGASLNGGILALDARMEAVEKLETWMAENPRYKKWDRIVASDEIIKSILARPKYNPKNTQDK